MDLLLTDGALSGTGRVSTGCSGEKRAIDASGLFAIVAKSASANESSEWESKYGEGTVECGGLRERWHAFRTLHTQKPFSRPSSIKEGIVHAALAQTEPAREKVEVKTAGKRKSRCHAALSAERSRTSVCVCVCLWVQHRTACICVFRQRSHQRFKERRLSGTAAVIRFISSTFLTSDLHTPQ